VNVIQPALLATVHEQLLVVVTVALPGPPVGPTFCDVGDRLYVQVGVGGENENVFEGALRLDPPGPVAETVAT
jgi:hypothetical protein